MDEQENLSAALKYANAGYPVLLVWPLEGKKCACPNGAMCETPGKHPMATAWQKTATTNAKRVEAMFKRVPLAHIGIMPPDGCCIIDIDPRNGGDKTMRTLLDGAKLPTNTPIQNSGGGGLHLFFKGNAGKLGKGIDIKRAGRGFVVAYPAHHISGGAYTWRNAPWKAKPLPLPAALEGTEPEAHEHNPADAPHVALSKIREALVHVNADEYQRWINIGQALRHTYGDDGEAVWLDWSRTSSKYKDGDEGKWESFDRNRDRPLITIRSIMSIARRSGYRPLATEFNGSLWVQGDISGYMENAPSLVPWAFDGCIPRGKVTLLAGAGGSSKSFLTLTLALQLAAQVELGPFVPTLDGGKALLLVAEEDKDDVHRRVHTIANARMYNAEQRSNILSNVGVVPVRGLDWRLLYHDDAGDVQETERVDYIIDEVKALGDVRFLVFDPLVAFNGANENDNAEMSRLMFTLDRIASETGAAVVVVHHVSKGGQVTSMNDASQAVVRGASALVDNARSAILLTRLPRGDAALYGIQADNAGKYVAIRFLKNNYGPHLPDAMFVVEAGGALRHAPEVVRTHTSVAVAQRELADEGVVAHIAQVVSDDKAVSLRGMAELVGRSHVVVRKHVQSMLEDGLLMREGMGKTTEYYVTAKGIKQFQIGASTITHKKEQISDLF